MAKSKSKSAPRTTKAAPVAVPVADQAPTPLEVAAQVAAVLHPTPDAVSAALESHPDASPLAAVLLSQVAGLDAVLASLEPAAPDATPEPEAVSPEPTPEPTVAEVAPTPVDLLAAAAALEPDATPALDDTEAAWEAADTALTAADDATAALTAAAAECQATAEAAAAAGTTVPTADQTRASLATDALAAEAAALRVEATAAAVVAEYVRLERDSRGTHPTIGRLATEHVAAVLASKGVAARGEAVKAVMARASHASGTLYTPQHLSRCMAVWGACRLWGADLVSALPVGVQKALATLVEREPLPGAEGHAEHYVALPHIADHAAALVAYCLTPRMDGAVPAHIRERLPRSGATARYVHSVPGVNGGAMALAEPVAKLCTELARYSAAKAAGKTAVDPWTPPVKPALPVAVVAAVDRAVAAATADAPAAVNAPAAGPVNPALPRTVNADGSPVGATPAADATPAEATTTPAAATPAAATPAGDTLTPAGVPTLEAAEADGTDAPAEPTTPAAHGDQGLAIPVYRLDADPMVASASLIGALLNAPHDNADTTLFAMGQDERWSVAMMARILEGAASEKRVELIRDVAAKCARLLKAMAEGAVITCPTPVVAK